MERMSSWSNHCILNFTLTILLAVVTLFDMYNKGQLRRLVHFFGNFLNELLNLKEAAKH